MKKLLFAFLLLCASICVFGQTPKVKWVFTGPKQGLADDPFSEGLAVYYENGKYGYIDQSGKIVIAPNFDFAVAFRDSVAGVQIGGKWGCIDHSGNYVLQPVYSSMLNYFGDESSGEFAEVQLKGKFVYIDKTGKTVEYAQVKESRKRRAVWGMVYAEKIGNDFKYGFNDEAMQPCIPVQYERALNFSEGLAAVKLDGKWGYINTVGEIVIPCKFEKAESFNDGLACVQQFENTFLIDRKGKMIIGEADGYKFDHGFSEGLAPVYDNKNYKRGYVINTFVNKSYPRIGIGGEALHPDTVAKRQLSVSKGIYINEIMQFGAAEAAGLQVGDIVVALNDVDMKSMAQFKETLQYFNDGEIVKVQVVRGFMRLEKPVVLQGAKKETIFTAESDEEKASKESEKYYASGNAKFNAKDYTGAINDYNKAIELNPAADNAMNNRGAAHLNLGDYDDAYNDCKKALEINPAHPYASANMQLALSSLNAEKALKLYKKGNKYFDNKDYSSAIDNYTRAIELNPNHADSYNNRGVAHDRLGEKQEAINDFNSALSIDPNNELAQKNKNILDGGSSWEKLGNALNAISTGLNAINNSNNAGNSSSNNYTPNVQNYNYQNTYTPETPANNASKGHLEQVRCSFCKGTGDDPYPSYGPSFGLDRSTNKQCPVCGKFEIHYHKKCPSCQGKGYTQKFVR